MNNIVSIADERAIRDAEAKLVEFDSNLRAALHMIRQLYDHKGLYSWHKERADALMRSLVAYYLETVRLRAAVRHYINAFKAQKG